MSFSDSNHGSPSSPLLTNSSPQSCASPPDGPADSYTGEMSSSPLLDREHIKGCDAYIPSSPLAEQLGPVGSPRSPITPSKNAASEGVLLSSPLPIQRAALAPPSSAIDSEVNDGWADPINSIELGASSSPFGEPLPQSSTPLHRIYQRSDEYICGNSNHPVQEGYRELPESDHDVEDNNQIRGTPEQFFGDGESRIENDSTLHADTFRYDRDDVEDVMNVPGKTALLHRPQDIECILSGERKPTSKELQHSENRRADLEAGLEEERAKHELEEIVGAGTFGISGPSLAELEEEGVAVPFASGVVAIDADKLDAVLNTSPVFVPDTRQRRASSPTGQRIPSSSFQFTPSSVVPTPGGKHIQFAPESGVLDTPFTKTLNYFKQFSGKENSPSRARRNASLPEEIAEVAKEAQQEEITEDDEDIEEWNKYREADLAPIDPVMEDNIAGDLIMLGTPIRKGVVSEVSEQGKVQFGHPTQPCEDDDVFNDDDGIEYELIIPGHYGEEHKIAIKTHAPLALVAAFIEGQGRLLDANDEAVDEAVENFLASSSSFIMADAAADIDTLNTLSDKEGDGATEQLTGGSAEGTSMDRRHAVTDGDNDDAYNKQLILYREDPVFVNVIAMIPMAMFWTVAQPVAHYSSKAFGKVVEKLGGLSLQ